MNRVGWLILSVISFIFCGIVYSSWNSGEINAIKANYYFNRHDIENAIKYYERAFESDFKDSKARYNYVTLIINSPLDSQAQEKLVKLIKSPINDNAAYKANSFLTELRYEIHKKYPDNYISQGTYNQKIIRWANSPITYGYVNANDAPEYYINEIDNAFSDWEEALDRKIKFKKVQDKPDIVISFKETKIISEDSEKYIAAITKPQITQNVLKTMTTDYYLTTPDDQHFSENQIYNTALHEIGHAIGFMGHSDYKNNIMHMSTDIKTVSNDIRKTLTKSDINTMKLLYSIKPDITNDVSASGEYTKYLILGNETDVTNAKIREAKSYIQKTPNLPSGYIDLADSYVSSGEYTKAVNCLNKALSLAKDNDTVYMIYYNLALTNYFMENYDDAKAFLNKSGSLRTSENSVRLLAEIYTKLGAKTEAINLYETLISKNPSDIEYVIALTNIYVRDKEYLKARKVLKNYVSKYPQEKNNPRLAPYGIIKIFL